MARKIVKEVTQPVVDGNTVVFAAGEQFGEDHVLPDGVPWKMVLAEVPDEPAPVQKGAVKAAGRPAGKS